MCVCVCVSMSVCLYEMLFFHLYIATDDGWLADDNVGLPSVANTS